MKLTFAGAADTVTGSRYLLDSGGRQILLDCGLFQGFKKLRDRNWAAFPMPPREIDRVVLSHAHLDHSGYLPALVRDGFRGQIVATEATRELCEILLRDSARLQEEEADFANRHGYSKHAPARPLYTAEDAERALARFVVVGFDRDFDLGEGIVGRFLPAGHLLGAAIVRLQHGRRTLVFSGDLGRPHDLVMRPPRTVEAADTLIVESTYGDRGHGSEDPESVLGRVIRETAARGGTVLIPSFAVGRAQTLLYALYRLKQREEIPEIPVFLDSPMAVDATRLYRRFEHDHRLTHEQCVGMYRAAQLVTTPAESKRLSTLRGPLVIISASGMATGGRVLHHLKRILPDAANHVVFAGFQAPGTRGAHLVAGEREVKIHGDWHVVRAGVTQLDGFSAHADGNELIDWMRGFHSAPKQVYVTHGEPEAADRLRVRISKELGWRARVPEHMETVDLAL
ncbi:MAG: MBL fold metallo-hydrolase [Lautropia sp.]|nr:MAG: MBL fold metallo-hydrolase [Pseudomonadota bacterium]MBC6960911.1 MBL fold metallo-hydrolase [Lautropia sp.]MCL4702555.1 MBL fold metallo-hydrolase [Burkholderiaceae bacterium]MDL1908969.1 MBL fold metallo-hydrolase [Betaproteobacteria bacterium PRO1]MEB2336323.1 MBL fold metallo-hydrolase [Burkholderiales bacterium]